jgi:hypothetical protein
MKKKKELKDEQPKGMSTPLKILILGIFLVMGIAIGKYFATPYGGDLPSNKLMFIMPTGCEGNTTCNTLQAHTETFSTDLGLDMQVVKMDDPSIYPAVYALSDTYMSEISIITSKEDIGIFLCNNVGGDKACNIVGPPKSETPKVWLFTMSHCPYGVQMQKAIIPVVNAFGDEIDFELKFPDYIMHGDKEIVEQMVQACIQEHYPEELTAYLNCFTQNGNTKYCTSGLQAANQPQAAKTNQTIIESCFAQLEDRLHIRMNARNESTYKGRYPTFPLNAFEADRYGVKGSPTLIINGKTVKVTRSPNAIRDVICEAFNTKSSVCEQDLGNTPATPGFGTNSEGNAGADAGCGT